MELIGIGLVQLLVLVELQEVLQFEASDQTDHPPVITQSGFLAGFVEAATQSS